MNMHSVADQGIAQKRSSDSDSVIVRRWARIAESVGTLYKLIFSVMKGMAIVSKNGISNSKEKSLSRENHFLLAKSISTDNTKRSHGVMTKNG